MHSSQAQHAGLEKNNAASGIINLSRHTWDRLQAAVRGIVAAPVRVPTEQMGEACLKLLPDRVPHPDAPVMRI